VHIDPAAVDTAFTDHFSGLIKRIAGGTPARKAPSTAECRFREITQDNCPERLVVDRPDHPGQTEDF
jgi:hypothetical protein